METGVRDGQVRRFATFAGPALTVSICVGLV
jgi:hypothetical protein